jgi:mannose-6-phosphate isomerase-like protein (cupin superfamily)
MTSEDKFERCNIYGAEQSAVRAHNGEGLLNFARIATRATLSGACNFIDFTCMPPGSTIGLHTHRMDEEEFYLILEGEGTMYRDGMTFMVGPGDLVRNSPGGTHSLANTGSADLKLFVFEVSAFEGGIHT